MKHYRVETTTVLIPEGIFEIVYLWILSCACGTWVKWYDNRPNKYALYLTPSDEKTPYFQSWRDKFGSGVDESNMPTRIRNFIELSEHYLNGGVISTIFVGSTLYADFTVEHTSKYSVNLYESVCKSALTNVATNIAVRELKTSTDSAGRVTRVHVAITGIKSKDKLNKVMMGLHDKLQLHKHRVTHL